MSRHDDDATDVSTVNRRAILKGASAGAVGLALGSGSVTARRTDDGSTGGPSPADDGDAEPLNCYTESRCLDETCDDDSTGCQYQWRDCCNYGTGYQCETWNDGGCCSCP